MRVRLTNGFSDFHIGGEGHNLQSTRDLIRDGR